MEIQKLYASEKERKLISEFIEEECPLEIDFNLLMPIVEKIEEIIKPNTWYEADRIWFEIKSHSVNIHCRSKNGYYNSLYVIIKDYVKDHRENVVSTKLEAIYRVITGFIEFHKTQTNK